MVIEKIMILILTMINLNEKTIEVFYCSYDNSNGNDNDNDNVYNDEYSEDDDDN